MAYTKMLCILANSIKFGAACVAGREVVQEKSGGFRYTDTWIRPISHRPTGEINATEAALAGKKGSLELFDIVEMQLQGKAAIAGQPEDWLITPGHKWVFKGSLDRKVATKSLLEAPKNLWLEGQRSDRVTPLYLKQHNLPSLFLVKPKDFTLAISEYTDESGNIRKKRRAHFSYNDCHYDLGLTDPDMQHKYFPTFPKVASGPIANSPRPLAVCVSLAPEFNGHHYKLVAAVIEP